MKKPWFLDGKSYYWRVGGPCPECENMVNEAVDLRPVGNGEFVPGRSLGFICPVCGLVEYNGTPCDETAHVRLFML